LGESALLQDTLVLTGARVATGESYIGEIIDRRIRIPERKN